MDTEMYKLDGCMRERKDIKMETDEQTRTYMDGRIYGEIER
jgi:hypothetical protein